MYNLFCDVILTWVKSNINFKGTSLSDDAEYEVCSQVLKISKSDEIAYKKSPRTTLERQRILENFQLSIQKMKAKKAEENFQGSFP
jgi:hypothetical protein